MTRHIHADHMIAAANDTTIEFERLSERSVEWEWAGKCGEFIFYPQCQYRQKPHPHQAMIDQAAADPSIQWQLLSGLGYWFDCTPGWAPACEYRQKPAEPVMVDMWQWAVRRSDGDIIPSTYFYASQDDAEMYLRKTAICRIEGSKITVPEVSQ